jgi:hypothetical protein
MTRSIFRIVLSTLALALLFAGSFNLTSSDASVAEFEAAPASKCQELAGCPGGSITCGTLILPDGTIVKCGMPQAGAD